MFSSLKLNCEFLQFCSEICLFISWYQTICCLGAGPVLAASIATYIHRFPLILVQPALFWLMPQYHRSVRRFPAIIRPFTLHHGIVHKNQNCTLFICSHTKLDKSGDCYFYSIMQLQKRPWGLWVS